jgi:hypothetical protein
MRKACAFLPLVAALCFTAAAFADDGGHGKGDPNKDVHARLAFSVVTKDNTSCGEEAGPWATDVVRRTFDVKSNGDGTYTLTRYDRGRFTTIEHASPGSCNAIGRHGRLVHARHTGKMVAYMRGTVTGGTFDAKAKCTGASCGSTDTFLTTFFGANAKFSCFTNSTDCAFNFQYIAPLGQALRFRHWQDKGKGAGSQLHEQFIGDIADV